MEKEKYSIKIHDLNTRTESVHDFLTEEGIHPDNNNSYWNLDLHFFGEAIRIEKEYFLSSGIDKIRENIEPKGFRMLVRYADYDAAHSGMQADMSGGSKIYKLEVLDELRKQKDSKVNPAIGATFHVLDESDIKSVTTLDKQKEFREAYFNKKRSKDSERLTTPYMHHCLVKC